MNFLLGTLGFAFGWAALTASFSFLNLVLGALLGTLAMFLFTRTRPVLLRRFRRILSLTGLFLVELWVSAVRVAVLVLRPDMRARIAPAVIAFPLSVKSDAEITLLANMITLTPGTLSIDVSEDRKFLYVHVLDVHDREALVRSIADGFERKINEVFQ